MKAIDRRFVVCIKADAGIDLEFRKVYEVLPDADAASEDLLRVIDESGEDYLYPASYFVPIAVTKESARALRGSARSRSGSAG